jgi:ribonuclease III
MAVWTHLRAWWRGDGTPERLEARARAAREAAEAAEAAARDARDRTAVEALVGRAVADLELYRQALCHRSALRGRGDSHLYSNERLEFLGDAVLGLVVGAHLYATFPDTDEGFLSRLRAKLVSGVALAERAEEVGIGPLLQMSPEMRQGGGERHATLLADAFEALIGALYLDLGLEAASAFIHRALLATRDLDALAAAHDNYKSVLLERAQAAGWPQPAYQVVDETGASHARTFTVEVHLRGAAYGTGQATSKKQAEQLAARAALERLAREAVGGDGQ